MATLLERVKFFHQKMSQKIDIIARQVDDEDEETKDERNIKEEAKVEKVPLNHLAEFAKDLKRAFFVLRAEVVAPLQEPKKVTSSLVLHVVCEGRSVSCNRFKTEALKVAGGIK